MYKFTNGIVVFDEKTRDAYIKAGMHLVEEKKVESPKEANVIVNEKRNGETRSSTKEDRKELREER
jgi:hypothetical protein